MLISIRVSRYWNVNNGDRLPNSYIFQQYNFYSFFLFPRSFVHVLVIFVLFGCKYLFVFHKKIYQLLICFGKNCQDMSSNTSHFGNFSSFVDHLYTYWRSVYYLHIDIEMFRGETNQLFNRAFFFFFTNSVYAVPLFSQRWWRSGLEHCGRMGVRILVVTYPSR